MRQHDWQNATLQSCRPRPLPWATLCGPTNGPYDQYVRATTTIASGAEANRVVCNEDGSNESIDSAAVPRGSDSDVIIMDMALNEAQTGSKCFTVRHGGAPAACGRPNRRDIRRAMHQSSPQLRVFGLAFGFLVCGVALPSLAGEATQARLVYVRGAGASVCPQQVQLRMAVAARLGYDPFRATAMRTVIAQIEEKSGELVGHVELVDEQNVSQGARQLTAPAERCSELVRAMALSISIAIDPESALLAREDPAPLDDSEKPEPTRMQRAAVATENEEPREIEAQPPPSAPKPIRFFSGAGVHVTNGAGPSSALGTDAFLGGRFGAFSLSVEERIDGRSSNGAIKGGVHVSFWLGSIVPCVHFGYATLCGTGTFGVIRASSSGLARDSSDTGNYTALGGRVGWDMPVFGQLWAGLHADAFAPWHTVSIKTSGRTLWTAPNVGTLLGFRVSAHF